MWLLQVAAQDLCQRQRLLVQLAEPLLRCHLDVHSRLKSGTRFMSTAWGQPSWAVAAKTTPP
jgi:hypothetical protein